MLIGGRKRIINAEKCSLFLFIWCVLKNFAVKLLIYLLFREKGCVRKLQNEGENPQVQLHGWKTFYLPTPDFKSCGEARKKIKKFQSWKNPNHNNVTWEKRTTNTNKRKGKGVGSFSLGKLKELREWREENFGKKLSPTQRKAFFQVFLRIETRICLQGKEAAKYWEIFPIKKALRGLVHENVVEITGFSFLVPFLHRPRHPISLKFNPNHEKKVKVIKL